MSDETTKELPARIHPPGTSELINYPYSEADRSVIRASVGGAEANAPAQMMHRYDVELVDELGAFTHVATIQFQRGPRNTPGSVVGLYIMHLFAIAIDWLQRAQRTDYSNAENDIAIEHAKIALAALQKRRDRRAARGTLGTHRPG